MNKLIKKENIGIDQVIKHLNRAQKDLIVAQANLSIDGEAAFNYAYLAILRTARALMFSEGYRPIDGYQHKTVVEFTGIVLGKVNKNVVGRFDDMRKKRNKFTYFPDIPVSGIEAKEAIQFAGDMVEKIYQVIKDGNPQIP